MRPSGLERKLVLGVLALFSVPTLAAGAVLFLLYRRGALEDPSTLALTVVLGFVAMMAYLGFVAHGIGRSLVRTLQEIQLGTELIASVNPDHRLAVRAADEIGALAAEINRMADHLIAARRGLEREVTRATRELVVERETLSAVLESLGEGVVVASAEGRVTLANRAAQDRLGAADAGLLGRSLFDFVDREKVAHFLGRLRTAEGRAERFSLHPGGDTVLEAVMTPFFDDERRLIGFILVLRDVTTPARSAEERQHQLEGVLRELRNRVASVRSLSESLLSDPAVGGSVLHRRVLEALHGDTVRLSGLVTDMASPGRLGLTRAPWHFEELPVSELAAMAVRRLGKDAGAVHLEVSPGLPPVRAEASAFSGVLAHLCAVVLARREAGREAWLRAARRGRLLQFDVGAAAGTAAVADLEAALDEPVPVDAARVGVREIVRQHAGEVWVYAEQGRAGFTLTVPGAEPVETGPIGETGERFIGAGIVSGLGADGGGLERPDLYDFSLLEEMERHVRATDRTRRLAELTYLVLDTETTGLAPDAGDRVVSIAGVRVRGAAVKRGERFDALVNPGRPIPDGSVRFHGITDAMVTAAPPIGVVLPAFLRFAEGAVLVGHQVWFDLRFLAGEAARLGLPRLEAEHAVLDTLTLSEIVHGPLPEHGLDAVATRLGVTVRGRHSALGDALATAEILARLLPLLEKRGIRTLGEALAAGRRARAAQPSDLPAGTGP